MKHQEQKYRVGSFKPVRKRLDKIGAKAGLETTTSTHYYARQTGRNVLKLVVWADESAIHRLEEHSGRFTLIESIPMTDTAAGLVWLKDQGCESVDIIRMVNMDYDYQDGIIGLYIINDFLRSVILDFPARQQAVVEKRLGLQTAERIDMPYNQYLAHLGKAVTTSL